MNDVIQRAVLVAPALLLSLSVHEYGHAWMATKLGDDTPSRQGRLTLSPLSHIDPIGTIVLPLVLLLTSPGMVFGWAKPVQFQPTNFTRKLSMWQGTALTASAGPVTNVVLALLAAVGLRVGLGMDLPSNHVALQFLSVMLNLNVLLAVFNLVPLPPLDGSYLIPQSLSQARAFLSRYSTLLFIGFFFLPPNNPIGSRVIRPAVRWLEEIILTAVSVV